MHYYQFNIGDYQSHTSHLSEMEDLAYRRLLDWYYLHELPIPLEITEIARQIRMRTHSECIAIVLQEYFERTADGWVHHRANKEIAKTGEKSEKASASAKARWNKKDANALPTQSESNATHNTEHITQDTEHKTQKKQKPEALRPIDVSESVWDDFIAIRNKVKKPFTETALKIIQREAAKAGFTVEQALETCCARGWQGFEAAWVKKESDLSKTGQMNQRVISGLTRGLIGGGVNVKLLGN